MRQGEASGALVASGAKARLALCVMTTPSMVPIVAVGDFLLIETDFKGRFEPGDLALLPDFAGAGQQIVHRVIGVIRVDGERWLVTKGDGNVRRDAPIRESSAAGRVVLLGRPNRDWIRL
ncbi:MAG: hypothetical protein ACHQ2Z_15630, partial [Elusimicrobiota bacterium]